jgi:hypothetical protein
MVDGRWSMVDGRWSMVHSLTPDTRNPIPDTRYPLPDTRYPLLIKIILRLFQRTKVEIESESYLQVAAFKG